MKLEELDFEINSDLIALRPKKPKDESKLLISEKHLKIIRFKNIFEILNPGDVLVINDTKVCLLYTSPSPRDVRSSRMPSSA